jgi:hypothetical protein
MDPFGKMKFFTEIHKFDSYNANIVTNNFSAYVRRIVVGFQ